MLVLIKKRPISFAERKKKRKHETNAEKRRSRKKQKEEEKGNKDQNTIGCAGTGGTLAGGPICTLEVAEAGQGAVQGLAEPLSLALQATGI